MLKKELGLKHFSFTVPIQKIILVYKVLYDKVFLSFLKRERERDFANVSDRLSCKV